MSPTLIALTVVVPIVFSLVIVALMLNRVRRASGGTKKQRENARRLVETGAKAQATVLAVNPTGLIVNHINLECRVDFQLTPLDGSPAFTGQKKMMINQAQMPRAGDRWPCWYDLADPTQFAVGQPSGADPQQIPVFREFRIPHPLDPQPF